MVGSGCMLKDSNEEGQIMKQRIRIQIIGNYLDKIRYSLNRAGIYTEDILRGGNPMGFVSLAEEIRDISFPADIETVNDKITQLTIKKIWMHTYRMMKVHLSQM